MAYRHLPFEEYFINTSEDYTHTGKVTYPVIYTAVKYCTTKIGKALRLSHEVNYEIHYEPERDVIQMHFQRTLGFSDWFANIFEFASRYYEAIEFEGEPLQLRVHHGWGNMYRAIKHEVRDAWNELHEQHPGDFRLVARIGHRRAVLSGSELQFRAQVVSVHLRERASVQVHAREQSAHAPVSRHAVSGLRELRGRQRSDLVYAAVSRICDDPPRGRRDGEKTLVFPAAESFKISCAL